MTITKVTNLEHIAAYLVYAMLAYFFIALTIAFVASKIVTKEYFGVKGAAVSKYLMIIVLLQLAILLLNINKAMLSNSIHVIWCFNGLFILTFWQFLFQIAIVLSTLVLYCSLGWYNTVVKSDNVESDIDFLVSIVLFAGLLIIMSNDLLIAYFCVELQTIPLFAILAIYGFSLRATDASLKYFILSIMSSSMLLFGIALVYNAFGTTNFSFLKLIEFYSVQFFVFAKVKYPLFVLSARLGVGFIIVAMLFKLTAAPFNFWIVDIYNYVSYKAIVIFALLPKFSITALLISIIANALHSPIFSADWQFFLQASAFLSVIVGTIGAFYHSRISAILAFGSVSHIGFVLFSLVPLSFPLTGGLVASKFWSFFYLFSYSTSFLLLFLILFCLKINRQPAFFLKQLSGLALFNKPVATIVTIAVLSLAGLPPFIGFIAKFAILLEWVRQAHVLTALAFFLTSLISSAYYLRFVKVIWFDGIAVDSNCPKVQIEFSFYAKIVLVVLTSVINIGGLYILFLYKYLV